METNWELNLPNWTRANSKSLEFIHSKASESFQYTIEVAEKLSSRAFTLISIIIPVVALILGLISGDVLVNNEEIPKVIKVAASLFCIPAVLSLGILIWMIFPKKFMHPGREPKLVAIPDHIQGDNYSADEQYISLLIGEIEDLQRKISYNECNNNRRIWALKWVLIITSVSVLVAMVMILYKSFITA